MEIFSFLSANLLGPNLLCLIEYSILTKTWRNVCTRDLYCKSLKVISLIECKQIVREIVLTEISVVTKWQKHLLQNYAFVCKPFRQLLLVDNVSLGDYCELSGRIYMKQLLSNKLMLPSVLGASRWSWHGSWLQHQIQPLRSVCHGWNIPDQSGHGWDLPHPESWPWPPTRPPGVELQRSCPRRGRLRSTIVDWIRGGQGHAPRHQWQRASFW